MGRASKVEKIDKDTVEKLLNIQCTAEEICSVIGVTRPTLRKWARETYGESYEDVAARFHAFGRASLRRYGYKHAQRNAAAWIFIAKNYLGMTDDPQPIDTGEARREFTAAIKAATKALEESDLSKIADIPTMDEGGEDAEKE